MATKRKSSSNDDNYGSLQGGDLDPSAENSETADSQPDNPDSRPMQAGRSAALKGDNRGSPRDPDRNPQDSIEAIDEGDSADPVLGADEAESRGNDDPTRSRSADVRDNPKGTLDKPGGRY